MDLFSLGDDEMAWMREDINETVNEAMEEALNKKMYSADVTIRIGVTMYSDQAADGEYALVPKYEYKSAYKIGAKYDRGKGKEIGKVGIRISRDGGVETVMMPEQTSMV